MKKNTIVLYADPASRASVAGLAAEFTRALGPLAGIIDIVDTDAAALRNGTAIDDRTLAFVLPGIVGEDSLYHAHLGAEGNEALRRYVQDGGVFMGLCAGAYYAATTIEYVPEWAPPRGRNSGILALFNGVARGPVPGTGIAGDTPGAYNGCTLAPVVLLEDGERAALPYSCGPAFYTPGENAEVLARYDVPGQPVAAFSEASGKGRIILSGVLPQYGVPDCWRMPVNPKPLDHLLEKIKPHEAARRCLWDRMVEIVTRHHALT